jgi:hypothetical protein
LGSGRRIRESVAGLSDGSVSLAKTASFEHLLHVNDGHDLKEIIVKRVDDAVVAFMRLALSSIGMLMHWMAHGRHRGDVFNPLDDAGKLLLSIEFRIT